MPLNFNPAAEDYDYWVDYPTGSHLDITAAITLCAWLKAAVIVAGGNNDYISKNDAYNLQLTNAASNQKWRFSFKYTSSPGAWFSLDDTVNAATGVWVFIAGTYDKNGSGNNMVLYKNGVSVASAAHTESIVTHASDPVSIGRLGSDHDLDPERYFHGEIDDARIYNRALSAAEIATLYACRGCDGIVNGLVLHSRMFEKGKGQTALHSSTGCVKDYSSYCNHGTPGYADIDYTESVLKMRK